MRTAPKVRTPLTGRRPKGSRLRMKDRMEILVLRFQRSWKLALLISSICTVLAVLSQRYDLLGMRAAEIGAYDDGVTTMTDWLGGPGLSDDVLILAIDDLTFQGVAANPSYALNFGQWPYSRNVWARVFEHLSNEGARAIVFDAVIDERHTDPTGDIAMGGVLGGIDSPFYVGFSVNASDSAKKLPRIEAKNRLPKQRSAAAKPAAEPAAVPATATAGGDAEEFEDSGKEETFDEGGGTAAPEYPSATDEEIAKALAFPVQFAELEIPQLQEKDGNRLYPQPPIAPLIPGTTGFGLVVMEEDDDGRLRRTRFAYSDGIHSYATLSLGVVADLFGAESVVVRPHELSIGNRTIKINADGAAEINYGGDLYSRFRTVSVLHALDDWAYEQEKAANPGKDLKAEGKQRRLPQGIFKDKVVLIGGFALGTADVKATPFSSATPGVVKHAAEIQSLLDNSFITEAPLWISVLITLFVAFFSMSIIMVFRNLILEVAWPIVMFYGFFVITGWFLVTHQVHILSAMPSLAASFCSVIGALFNHFFAPKKREELARAFDGSMDGILLAQLVEHKHLPSLEGEYREITVLSADIIGFSKVADQMRQEPDLFTKFLNRYHSAVTSAAMRHGGFVEGYSADSGSYLFGAPLPATDHAARACLAALDIQEAVEALKKTIVEDKRTWIDTRIGINTGKVFVGNFGSDYRVEYRTIGEEGVKARLVRDRNKAHTTRILVGSQTEQLVRPGFRLNLVETVALTANGPKEPIFELQGKKNPDQPQGGNA